MIPVVRFISFGTLDAAARAAVVSAVLEGVAAFQAAQDAKTKADR